MKWQCLRLVISIINKKRYSYYMHLLPQHKTFILGLSISFLIVVSFFGGGLADRIFVVKPLDLVTGEARLPSTSKAKVDQKNDLVTTTNLSAVPDIVEATAQSVVTVTSQQSRTVQDSAGTDLFGIPVPGSQTQRTELVRQDRGTGFVVTGGFIVTNRHVVPNQEGASYIVIDAFEREHQVLNIYRDPSNDLAILKLESNQLPPVFLGDSDAIRVGESVVAIGNALGEFRNTVTTGVVSGLGRGVKAIEGTEFESIDGVIQTDAAMSSGNSGGPLINADGQVIGVNVAVSAVGQNIGFSIPINVVKASLENFNQTGQFDRPSLGVRYRMVSAEAAAFNNVPEGALVSSVVADSVAAKAGLQTDDIIIEFAGKKVVGETNMGALINQQKIGSTTNVTFWRSGSEQAVEITF